MGCMQPKERREGIMERLNAMGARTHEDALKAQLARPRPFLRRLKGAYIRQSRD